MTLTFYFFNYFDFKPNLTDIHNLIPKSISQRKQNATVSSSSASLALLLSTTLLDNERHKERTPTLHFSPIYPRKQISFKNLPQQKIPTSFLKAHLGTSLFIRNRNFRYVCELELDERETDNVA